MELNHIIICLVNVHGCNAKNIFYVSHLEILLKHGRKVSMSPLKRKLSVK